MIHLPSTPNIAALRTFVVSFADLLSRHSDEPTILREGGALLGELVSRDDWLPDEYAQPDPVYYRQYLLHADSAQRFSVVSFVWGPGQVTPIHDHTVWGLIGMLRGAEYSQPYVLKPSTGVEKSGNAVRLEPGQVEAVSPSVGDVHRVSNAYDDQVSISIHVYGANIGAVSRSVYTPEGERKPFISGYHNTSLPNLWDVSKELKRQ